MTKQDILNMKTSREINHTIMTNPELWDEEVRDYLLKVKRKELFEEYGSEDVLVTPPRKNRIRLQALCFQSAFLLLQKRKNETKWIFCRLEPCWLLW